MKEFPGSVMGSFSFPALPSHSKLGLSGKNVKPATDVNHIIIVKFYKKLKEWTVVILITYFI